jgi:hypothetical protein
MLLPILQKRLLTSGIRTTICGLSEVKREGTGDILIEQGHHLLYSGPEKGRERGVATRRNSAGGIDVGAQADGALINWMHVVQLLDSPAHTCIQKKGVGPRFMCVPE